MICTCRHREVSHHYRKIDGTRPCLVPDCKCDHYEQDKAAA